jgi:ATP-dependent DNA helicase RecG
VIPTRRGLRIFQAVLEDDTGMITVAWPGQPWLDRKLREGDTLLVTGKVKFFHGRQLQPREYSILSRASDQDAGTGTAGEPGSGAASLAGGLVFVTYPATEELPQWVLRGIFDKNLEAMLGWADDDEYLSPQVCTRLELPGLAEALTLLHRAFDELFFLQLVQAQARRKATALEPGIAHRRTNRLVRPLHESLPFSLTEAQARALREVYADMQSEGRMNRLLQGDVGSGKTAVATFAMALAVEGGSQAVLMAPTEILAEQHARGVQTLLAPLDVKVQLLTGRLGAAERRQALGAVASGEASIVVGTHALIQDAVRYRALGLVVIDEQHRFGVRQRMALLERDDGRPDVLVMSATPIPRSLAMALYGDLDISVLDEMPPGRTPVKTALRSHRGGAPGLHRLPARRGVREDRSAVRDGGVRSAPGGPVRGSSGRAPPWAAAGQRKGHGHAGFRERGAGRARRDHRHRSGNRRPERDGHGHRARGEVRPVAAASAARPGGQGRGRESLHRHFRAR